MIIKKENIKRSEYIIKIIRERIYMFENESKNEEMLYGAYKKLKSYYHYNKNNLFLND